MKNIHILATDKPSRLHEYDLLSLLGLSKEPLQWRLGRNIYITSEEDIKEGDLVTDGKLVGYYSFDEDGCPIIKSSKDDRVYGFGLAPHSKKIILTTDQELIKNGVQAIDDEFLEWFVKNPSCEEVEIVKTAPIRPFGSLYKIIILKEETLEEDLMMEVPMAQYPKILKHEFKVVTTEDIVGKRHERYSERFDNDKSPIGNPETWGKRLVDETLEEPNYNMKQEIIAEMEKLQEPKQETLEEVELSILFHNTYEKLAPSFGYETRLDTKLFDTTTPNGKLMIAVCKEIIKWQQENSCKHNYILTTEQGHRVIKCLKCDNSQPI